MTNKYVITVSYGDHTVGAGGTDKAVLTQQRILNSAGYNVVSLSPFHVMGTDHWNVLYNGAFDGIYSKRRIRSCLSDLRGQSLAGIIIHHLLFVNISLLCDILDYCDVPVIYYLHDYYTICPESGLVREDGTFCGNGFPTMLKCRGCSHYEKSVQHINEIRPFIKKYADRITFVAPSDTAKRVWSTDYPECEDKVRVIYHQELVGEYAGNSEPVRDDEPLKIAFVGYQSPHKGWNNFREAAEYAQRSKANERFYQFGWGDEKPVGVEQVDVDFKKSLTAMTDKLREEAVHTAVIWSTLPETYAYTYYEALAANCFVITNELSGNVCAQVKKRGNGLVTDDLGKALADEEKLRALINTFRTDGHKTPEGLKESEQFLGLISGCGRQLEPTAERFDISVILTVLKKIKRRILKRKK